MQFDDKLVKHLRLNEKQKKIFEGLKQIGEEISFLYLDGIKIFQSNIISKPYLLSHIAREIEGGIRDIWCSSKKKDTKKGPQCGRIQTKSNHIDEICEILGVDKSNDFAKIWHETAKEFHKYAHRQGPWKEPRQPEEFDKLWKRFEDILWYLVGSYLNLLKRVDSLIKYEEPTEEILGTLNNLLKNEAIANHFFKKLESVKWFESLVKRGYFTPEKAPSSIPAEKEGYWRIPFWNVLNYLEKVSKQVTQPGNEKYTDELLEIIKNVTEYHIKNNKCLDNYFTWWYFVKILCNLPTDKITDEVVDLIPIWLESKFYNRLPASEILKNLLPKFLDSDKPEDLQKAEKILDFVTQIKWIPKYTEQQKKEIREKYKHIFEKPEEQRTDKEKLEVVLVGLDEYEPKMIVDKHWIVESFINEKIAQKMGEKCSERVIYNLADKLVEIFKQKYKEERKNKKYDLSYIRFRSLFEVSFIYGAEEKLTLILREILLAKAKKDVETTNNVIRKFLSDYSYPIFTRLVLFIIGTEWNNYKNIFWDLLDESKYNKSVELFNDPHYEPEVYTILNRHISKFLIEEKEKIKNIVEEKVPKEVYPEEKHREYYQAHKRQIWYSAVKDDDDFKPIYEKYKSITKKEEKLTFTGPEVRVGPGPSPLTKEEILKMSNEELAEYLKNFRTVGFWEGPTIGGLSDTLKEVVQEKPEKFVDDLNPFLKTGYLYVYDILWGIRDAWEKKKPINWEKLFNFIKEYITSNDFWDDKYKIENDYWDANHFWIVGMIGELIRQGTYDDSWAFSEEQFQIAQEILFLIVDKMLEEKGKILSEQSEKEDYVAYALNSPFGKITEALFMLALRIKRIEKNIQKKQLVSWEINIREKYDLLMSSKIIESYVWFGRYLPNFYYLDKEWTENKIKSINSEQKQLWEAFMDGYLSGSKIYDELYILMKPHYEKAIDYKFKRGDIFAPLVQHICIEYLRGLEDINDNKSLFRKLFDKWETSQIIEIISFSWYCKDEHETDEKESEFVIGEKVINFWRWVYENKYKNKQENELSGDDKKILSELSLLTIFLPEINDENSKWIEKCAPFVDVDNSSFFIEYLDRLKDKGESVNFIGKIYLEMLKNTTPIFREEHIKSIVEFLYQKDKKEEADKICNIYSIRGYEFLIDLYDKYNKA